METIQLEIFVLMNENRAHILKEFVYSSAIWGCDKKVPCI